MTALLRENEKRFRLLAENARDLIFRYRLLPNPGFEYVSPAATTITGYTPEEHYADPELGFKLVHPDDRPLLEAVSRGEISPEKPLTFRWQRKDGTIIWTEQHLVFIFDETGRPVALEGTARDVTERRRAEEILHASEARHRGLIEAIPDAILRFSRDGTLLDLCLPADFTPFGLEARSVGKKLADLLPPDAVSQVLAHIKRTIGAGKMPPYEYQISIESETYYREARLVAIGPDEVIAIIRDITERKRVEETLKTYARVLESMAEGVVVWDTENRVIFYTNPAFDAMFGYEPGELVGQPAGVLDLDAQEVEDRFLGEISEVLETQGTWLGELRNRKKDGTPFTTQVRMSFLETPRKKYGISVQEDITQRKQIETEKEQLFQEVSRQREHLRALARQLAEAQEVERKELARELHDQVGQNLTGLSLNLNLIRARLAETALCTGPIQARFADSLTLIEQTTERIRDLMANLRPPGLDDYGLIAALRWYGTRLAERASLTLTVQGDEPHPRLAAPVETALFRITQEALTNVVKHAHASQVTLTIEQDALSGTVRLIITDDGHGFDLTSPVETPERAGWGLLTMTERAEAVGGQCRIESMPGNGARIIIEV